jgi:hypothetical protein
MLYGHGKRGTEGPIMVVPAGTPYYEYFARQIRWLENLASGRLAEPWTAKGIRVWPLKPVQESAGPVRRAPRGGALALDGSDT